MTENSGCGLDLIFPQGSNAGLVIQNGLYGVCSTNASTQEKTVDIEGFTSENLVEGTCITVRFAYMQLYDGTPKLNVSGTGAKNIQSRAGTNAGKGEWYTGQIVEFVYYNNAWVIVDGSHATTNYYGKTKLTDDFSAIDNNSAATGQMVTALAGYVAKGWLWDGNEHESTVLLNTTTPDGDEWDPYTDQLDKATIHYTDFGSVVNYNPYNMRMLKVTFGDRVFFKGLDFRRPFEEISIYYDEDYTDAHITIGTSQTEFICHPPYADLPFKVELYSGYGDAGLVTYPLLKDYVSLPKPTVENVGASVVVKSKPVKGDAIVPEQSVYHDGSPVELINSSTALFIVGNTCIGSINGKEYTSDFIEDGDLIGVVFTDDEDPEIHYAFFAEGGDVYFGTNSDGLDSVEYAVALYETVPYALYGLEKHPSTISAVGRSDGNGGLLFDITFAQVFEALQNGIMVQFVFAPSDDHPYNLGTAIALGTYYDGEVYTVNAAGLGQGYIDWKSFIAYADNEPLKWS